MQVKINLSKEEEVIIKAYLEDMGNDCTIDEYFSAGAKRLVDDIIRDRKMRLVNAGVEFSDLKSIASIIKKSK